MINLNFKQPLIIILYTQRPSAIHDLTIIELLCVVWQIGKFNKPINSYIKL